MAPLVRRTWSPKGCTPILKQRGRSHRKVSAIAAIVVSPCQKRIRLYFRLHPEKSIRATLVKAFVSHLSKQVRGRFIIVWDRLNTHRARIVTLWILSNGKVMQEYFPPYAPELNPVEYVWGYVKTGPMANLAKTDVRELAQTAFSHTRRIQKRPGLLRSFLKHSSLFLSR